MGLAWTLQTLACPAWAFQRCVEPVVRAVAGLSKAAMRHLAWYCSPDACLFV